jgi:hypothetical protein
VETALVYHTLTFSDDLRIHSPDGTGHGQQRRLIPKGTPLQARTRPYVVEGEDGPVEVADLFLPDGTALHMLPFECFSFVE